MSPGLTPHSASHSYLDLESGQIGGCSRYVIFSPSVTGPSLLEYPLQTVHTCHLLTLECFPYCLLLLAHLLTPLSMRLCPLVLHPVWDISGASRR